MIASEARLNNEGDFEKETSIPDPVISLEKPFVI